MAIPLSHQVCLGVPGPGKAVVRARRRSGFFLPAMAATCEQDVMPGRGSICCASLASGGGRLANGNGGSAAFDAAHERLEYGLGKSAGQAKYRNATMIALT